MPKPAYYYLMWALYYEANLRTSRKKEALRCSVTTVTIPAVELDSRSIRTVILKGKHEKDDMYIAFVDKFMLCFTFSLSFVGNTATEILLGITLLILLGIRDNCAQNYRDKG